MTMTKTNGKTISAPTATINNTIENEKKSTTTMINELINEEEITLEDLAPDGGWGWMIALAMILTFFTTMGPSSSFAIIFGDFLEDSGQAGMASSLFNSLFMVTFSTASLLTNTLLKRYSIRPVGIVGALFFAIPNIIIAFVRNIYEMAIICFFQGFGMGLIITVTNTIFNAYFVKKRAKVMSTAHVIISLGGIIYPTLTEKLIKLYGFRGTAVLMGAISLNAIVGMTMMHPVEWHARKPEEIRAERAREKERQLHESALLNRRSTIDVVYVSSKTRWSSLRSLKEEKGTEIPLLIETLKTSTHRVASISTIEGDIHGGTRSLSMRESLARRMSALSATSLGNLATHVGALGDIREHFEKKSREKQADKEIQKKEEKEKVKEKEIEKEKQDIEEKQEETECKTILKELLDMSLVKNCGFINLCFGISFVATSDFAFSSLLPLIMTDAGYTKGNAALTVTVSGLAELVSKVLLAVFTLIVDVKAKYLFFSAMICMEFARIGFLLYENTLMGALIMTAIIGMVRSWLMVPQPLVIIEDVNIEKFASAYGIFSVISGLVTIVFGAIVGLIKDWTNSFEIYQVSLLVLNGAFIIPWALQFILVDFRKWRKQRAQAIIANYL